MFSFVFVHSGFVEAKNVESYLKAREKFKKKGNGNTFVNAVQKCEEFIADPLVNKLKLEHCIFKKIAIVFCNL